MSSSSEAEPLAKKPRLSSPESSNLNSNTVDSVSIQKQPLINQLGKCWFGIFTYFFLAHLSYAQDEL